MAMAPSTLGDLFKLSEEDATYVLVTYVNSCGGSVTWMDIFSLWYLVNCIANYDFNDENIAP